MTEIILILLGVITLAVIALLIVASTRPSHLRVSRSTEIDAAPEAIHATLNDFHRFPEWSPWQKLDPEMDTTFSGAERGVGAIYEWSSPKAGQGRQEITASTPERIDIQLDFLKPYESHCDVAFLLEPAGETTRVTWSLESKNSFMAKLMGIFMNMEQMIAKDYDEGLANLKQLAEG